MATLRELKTRIGSVSSSEKITGAMKMISSAKVHKNEQELRRLLPYKEQIRSIMGHLLSTDVDFTSPLLEKKEVNRMAIVVFGSDDGLCGAYNMYIFKYLLQELNKIQGEYGKGLKIDLYPVGKKIAKALKKVEDASIKVVIEPDVNSKMSGDVVTEFTEKLRNRFLTGEYDKVNVVFTQFISMSKQVVTGSQLFPVTIESVIGEDMKKENDKVYIFEPDANKIFNAVLPMFVLSTMQEVTIENRASEQAARVMAMQSANDNAKKLLDELQLEYNKLRQQSITTELLDILGGQVER